MRSQAKDEALQQFIKDSKWWLGGDGGEATLNGARNRDIQQFWKHAQEEHADVRSQLREVPFLWCMSSILLGSFSYGRMLTFRPPRERFQLQLGRILFWARVQGGAGLWSHAVRLFIFSIECNHHLTQAAKVNREKGVSAAGSKAALAGDETLKPQTQSLYKEEYGNLKPKSAEMAARMLVQQEVVRNSIALESRSGKFHNACRHEGC